MQREKEREKERDEKKEGQLERVWCETIARIKEIKGFSLRDVGREQYDIEAANKAAAAKI